MIVVLVPSIAGAAPVEFRAHSADGKSGEGRLVELSAKGGAVIEGKQSLSVKEGELIELRRLGMNVPAAPSGPQLILRWADRIALDRGGSLKLVGDTLHFRPACADGSEWTVPLSNLALFWRSPPEGTAHPEKLRLELAGSNRKRDVLLLANGDSIDGILEAWDETDADKRIQIDASGKKSTVAASKIAVVALTTDPAGANPAKKPYIRVVLVDGSRLSFSQVSSDGGTLTAKTLFGTSVRLPLEQVIALTTHRQRATYLSDLTPTTVKDAPFLPGLGTSFRADRTLDGAALCLGGDHCDKGIAMRGGASLTYSLDGSHRRFQAVVGLDAHAGKLGAVRIRILLDGKPQDEARLGKELTAKTPPLTVDLDVTGAKELTLVVESGSSGPVQDHVDWANARLIR